MKSSVYIAISLDGYIARMGGELDWLDMFDSSIPKGEDLGYYQFIDSVDVLVMGRNTFDKVLSFGVSWPYGNKQVVVLSRNKIDIPAELSASVSHSSESPGILSNRLKEAGAKRIYVDGGITIQRFLAEGLITDLNITIIPIILGGGIPLFGEFSNCKCCENS